ncbi:TonB-dependent receptor [Bacteroides xylanisolvens SD CC 2a]|nr:SusC/RagA family TonB-linked outer membrane protein [Bacteroides xylanisolvens]EEZ05323.1 TonB-linked outer membrane protein, SusC/RagA family [Bacteroides sp. 2_1_22]EFF58294.1 TonB-dependent receptor [Bacteroides xylanisolvens SD CC 2a]KAB6246635.1 SusC/RagA family TonB-linked outer membrane protein [Bacteroides xylanisolvens]CBK67859.1 Outer membrane receptor proteins, mostly Fe transport [Bacteroides xylanisolvens XB1A]
MSISYNDSQLPVNRISLDIEKQPLEQALKVILKGTGFTYLIKDNYIMIVPEQNIKKAKSRNISGNVVDAKGEPLIGVTVIEKGTTNGAVTDLDGNYKITTKTATPVLVFSYVGYQTKETHATENIVNIVLEDGAQELGEVVVTALGIKRSEKALSYNVQKVGNDAVTTVKSANFMNSLSGKVAGVNINASSAGMGGAARVVMRGPKSISQSNQALYVIDGIPVTGRSQGELKGDAMMYANQPGTESIADVNPEDIESISVLSGPAAAALYGSAAAQGVVMITTKKGQEGKVSVTISNSSQFANPFVMPKFQDQYVNRPGEIKTWGDKATSEFGTYEPADFFNTGTNIQNNISLTAGTSKNQTYLSVGTTNAQGIIPNNSYDRYNFTFRNTTSFLNDKMTCDFNFNYIREKDKNLMAQGQWFNPLTSLYLFPRGESFDAIRTFEVYDPVRKIYVQNWNYGDALKMQNPYWVANRMNRTNDRNRYMVSASLKYEILDWLNVTGRLRWDDAATKQEDKRYASTLKLFAPSDYGFYGYDKINDQTLYGDLMLNINKTLGENFSISSNMGASFSRLKYDVTGFQGGLKAPSNVFTPNAIDYGNATNDNRPIFESYKHYINSMFISAELGYRSMLYLTLTGRNDWDSALHGTAQTSFFYPSVGVSAVISEMAKMPQMINYLKVRASWASVGSAIEPNLSSAWRYEYNPALGTYKTVTYKFPKKFYPERTDSWEAGVTARLFGNALSVDLTVYQSNTRKQTLLRDVTSGAAGFNKEYIQTGNIRNRGLELSVGYTKSWADFTWSSSLAYSMNRNKIVELLENPNEVVRQAGLSGCGVVLKKGGGMGDIYTYTDFKRDAEGNIALDSNGNVMQTNLSNPQYRGSVLPKGNLGFSNDFSWKGVNLGFVLTARLGGICMSQTQAILDEYGVSAVSAEARNNGGIAVNTGKISAEGYYAVVGGDNPIWSEYIYSATNVRLQEAHISYTLPRKWLKSKELTLGVTANNLFMIYRKAPFDPESTASTGTYYQGFDYFMQPSLRTLGFNIKLKL